MERQRKPRRRVSKLVALSLAATPFVVGEVVLRVQGFEYERFEFPIQVWNAAEDQELADESALHRFDDHHFWLPREHVAIPWASDERVSAGSFRGEDPDPEARWKVLVLGDSSTFGWHVSEEELYAELLERDLEASLTTADTSDSNGRQVQVLNGGVIGYTVRQGLVRYQRIAPTWRPDVVISALGTVNDHVPTMDLNDIEKLDWLRRRRRPIQRFVRFLRDHVRLLHLFAWTHDELRGGREAWFAEMFGHEVERRTKLQNYRENPDYKRRVSPDDFEQALGELYETAESDRTSLIFLHMPRTAWTEEHLPQVLEYDARLREFTEREGLRLVDARGRIRSLVEQGASEDELFWDGTHPKAAGQRVIADILFPVVRDELQALGRR